ncbi:hypothetical protein [Acidovorax radicis]|uniref:hypothetical protein n=1 Tax=Acidovorax radicis TaxID=758826 RepID=UPI001CFC0738|nr:hypothetical protein [Acidovorax radicis]UCV00265.1 hypothetical protein KI609_05625 [Acidovorax radicis]
MDPKSIPAFPVTEANGSNDGQPGMTLRDYFAANAMQVFLANTESSFASDAKNAYAMADAMLAAR